MSATPPLPPPERAWQPFDTRRWDEACARHLLRRMGFSATPGATAQALREGPAMTVRRAFSANCRSSRVAGEAAKRVRTSSSSAPSIIRP